MSIVLNDIEIDVLPFHLKSEPLYISRESLSPPDRLSLNVKRYWNSGSKPTCSSVCVFLLLGQDEPENRSEAENWT